MFPVFTGVTVPADSSRSRAASAAVFSCGRQARKELVDRLKSVRTIRNRIGHDENLLRVEFAKLRYDMFFILDALGPECPNWAFPDKGEALKTLNPARCIATWQNDSEDRK